jgi:hypothetical protein
MFQSLLDDVQLNVMIVNALRLSHEFADIIREGYSQGSFYGDESGWTKDNRIEAKDVTFWRLDRFCVPRNSDFRLRLIFEMHDN